MKKSISILLVVMIVIGLYSNCYAAVGNEANVNIESRNILLANWLTDKAKKAKEEAEKAAKKAKEAAKKAKKAVEKAADKAEDWTEGAVEDAADWTEGAVEDAADWTEGAVEDAADWTEGAVEDATDWTKGAVEDIADAVREEKKKSELSTLPLLTLDESKMTNIFNPQNGTFSSLENVREKKLSSNTYSKLKDKLKKIKIPGYIVDFILENVVGVEGDNIGGKIADLLPGSVLYGDKVADAINEVVNQDKFEEVDLYKEAIAPKDYLKGFTACYDIPAASLNNKNNLQLIATGLSYGKRDSFNVYVSLLDSNGKETSIPVVKKALNGKEVAFEAIIGNLGTDIEKIRIKYINKFDKPKDPSKLIADGIKDAINGVSPGSPISNATRDNIIKILDKMGLNELGGNGDVGVLIAENIVGQIPLVGTAVKLVGGTDWLAKTIRKVVGQVEVKSYAKISNARVLINSPVSIIKQKDTSSVINPPSNPKKKALSTEGASSWAVPEINEAYELNLYTDKVMGKYTSNITRAEFAGLVVKLYEALTGTKASAADVNTFKDTKDEDVLKAYKLKIVNGNGDGNFSPDNLITREQMAVMYYNTIKAAFDKKAKTMPNSQGKSKITDRDSLSDWAVKQVEFIFEQQIITGDGSSFNPKGNATREAAIAVVKRVYKKFK